MKQIIEAFQHAFSGLWTVVRTERAFKQELFVFVISVSVALMIDVSLTARLLLISSVTLVLVVELVNTAIETTVDRISTERHELSEKAKDVSSAAVLLTIAHAAIVWGIIVLRDVLEWI